VSVALCPPLRLECQQAELALEHVEELLAGPVHMRPDVEAGRDDDLDRGGDGLVAPGTLSLACEPPRAITRPAPGGNVNSVHLPATVAVEGPEEIGVLRLADSDELEGQEVVAREGALAREPADATAERDAADAGFGDDAGGHDHPVLRGLRRRCRLYRL